MNKPKMTVIIPTRERCDVLEKSLKTVTAQDYDNLEIIVSDNFSSDATEQVVRGANDARVRYINTGKRVSMSHNWEFGLSFALSNGTDGWVTIIGDDDGLMPNALSRLSQIVGEVDVEAIQSRFSTYGWPAESDAQSEMLVVPLTSGYEIRDSNEWMSKVLEGEACYTELPLLYTGGWAKLETIGRLKNLGGSIYKSAVPDVYSGFAIASVVDRYMYLFEPLAIGGSSKHSNGASFLRDDKKSRDIRPVDRFTSEPNISFHHEIPLCSDGSYPPSIQALTYESYLQSEFLRPPQRNVDRERQRARQIEVILEKSTGNSRAKTLEWLSDYTKQYDLNLDHIVHKVSRDRKFDIISNIKSKLQVALEYYIVSGRKTQIRDVFQASIEASRIRLRRPGMLEVIRAKIFYVVARSWRQRSRRVR